MAKIFQTLRNNWKKSIFFTGVAIYGVKYGQRKYDENLLMRKYAKEASQYGQHLIPNAGTRPYHVTVVLNPAASGGGARKRFEEYCAPLLNLAGLKVSVIRTEAKGQAKEILAVMEDTDAVLVAGGDGTLQETVTGLLRRSDFEQISRALPIGVLPIGAKNRMARHLFPESAEKGEVALMAEAAMSVVRSLYREVDVIEVKIIDDETIKPLYGLRQLSMSVFDQAHERKESYWYWAGLKKYMTYVWSYLTSHSSVTWHFNSWSKIGNRKIIEDSEDEKTDEVPVQSSRSLWSYVVPSGTKKEVVNVEKAVKEKPIEWTDKFEYAGCELRLESPNNFPLSKDDTKHSEQKLSLNLGPDHLNFSDFVQEGWRREKTPYAPPGWLKNDTIEAFEWHPEESLKSTEDKEKVFYLDGESIEILGPIRISLLKDKIVMFCSDSVRKEVKASESSRNGGNEGKKWWQKTASVSSNLTKMPKLNT